MVAAQAFSPSLCLSVSLLLAEDGETEGRRDGVSSKNSSSSSTLGGRPIRSYVTRRSSVRGSASGAGERPFSSSFARMKLSIGLRGQLVFFTGGTAGSTGGV